MRKLSVFVIFLLLLSACGSKKTSSNDEGSVQKEQSVALALDFNADSAYAYVDKQVSFGPRVPGSEAHRLCGDYLVAQLNAFGAVVEEQTGQATLYDGKVMKLRNIIGHINPSAKRRILLSSHWDTRPFSDQDKNSAYWNTPISGANDGASGVGVLLEVARQLQHTPLSIGVDIVFFDLEDWGAPEFYKGEPNNDSYCLGSQYWAKSLSSRDVKPEAGILLDMVGAPGARFFQEQISTYYAPQVVDQVWSQAKDLGFHSYFIDQKGGAITDDHLYVNKLAGIPCIDIIQYDPYSDTGFGAYWHTQQDTMEQINKTTLHVVGQTLLQYLLNYN